MAITYPLTVPASTITECAWLPKSIVGMSSSQFTGQQQVQAHLGAWWELDITFLGGNAAKFDAIAAFLLALNGREGTFSYGPEFRNTTRGTAAGSWAVGSGAVLGSTTLPISGGTGAFVVGDWLQVGNQIFRVTQLNSGSLDVFPKLRSAYASGTAITYTAAKGVFRMTESPAFIEKNNRTTAPITIHAIESI